MRAIRRSVFALMLLLIPFRPAGAAPACDATGLDFEVVLQENHSPVVIDGQRDFVIRDQERWCEAWELAHANVSPAPPCDLSAVDFRHEVAIGVSGQRPDSCGGPHIEKIEQSYGRKTRVSITELHVAGCGCYAAITYPTVVVAVAQPVRDVEFVHQQAFQVGCGGPIGFGPEPPPTIVPEPIR